MKMKRIVIAMCVSAGVLTSLSGPAVHAHGGKAHVHGNAVLQVVMEGSQVEIALQSPMDNLVGFEHEPRTDQQRKAVQALREQFHKPASLFVLNAEAGCKVQDVELDLPFREGRGADSHGHGHESHADIESVVRYQCEHPALLKSIDLALFDRFSGIHRIDAQVVSVRGQSAARLTPKQRKLQW